MRHRIMLNMLKETLINVYAFPLRYQTVALQRWGRREGGGTRQSGWLIENFYQLLRILWAFYLYAAWLAGWLTASCMLPCFPLPSACSLPVPTRSPRAPACSLFSPSDINVAFTCDFPSASSFLHIPLPHPYLHRCFTPASSPVYASVYPSPFPPLLPSLPRGRQYLWQCDQRVVGRRLRPYRSLVSMSLSVWASA